MKKSELLYWLQEENQRWEALLDQVGATRMDKPGVNSDWSMKGIVARTGQYEYPLEKHHLAAVRHAIDDLDIDINTFPSKGKPCR